jgi:ferrochelatase
VSAHTPDGVLLMTYGSPASLEREDIRTYLTRVRGGREPAADLVDEFVRRYRLIGGSPLVEITRAQANALSDRLGWPVDVGMRFSDPTIGAGLAALAKRGVGRVAAIVLSPQYSPLLMGGYRRSLEEARAALGSHAPDAFVAAHWHDEPAFVDALAARVRATLARSTPRDGERAIVLMTAHSLPRRVAEQEPTYVEQLRDTAQAVAKAAGLEEGAWRFCWQSAGHEPGEWMKPDLADVIPEAVAAGRSNVLVAPVQFLADHLEVLYDIDVAARAQAERYGLRFRRVESLNVRDGLIEALSIVARRTLDGRQSSGQDESRAPQGPP